MSAESFVRRFMMIEWFVTVVWGVCMFIFGHFASPFCRTFQWTDSSLSYPFDRHETFPSWSLIPIVGVPAFIYVGIGLALKHRPMEINLWCLMQAQSVVIMLTIVEPCKLFAGRLRPDFLDRLRMQGFSETSFASPDAYCSIEGTGDFIREGRLSFPSGHSSTSTSGMVPLSFYLFLVLRVFASGSLIRLLAALSPLALSTVVSITRARNYRHHFADILAGDFIGLVAALLALALRFHIGSSPPTAAPSRPDQLALTIQDGSGCAADGAQQFAYLSPQLGIRWRRSQVAPFAEVDPLRQAFTEGAARDQQSMATFSALP